MSAASSFIYHTETINGIEVQKPLPKRLHAIIQQRIQLWLSEAFKGTAFEVLPSLDMLCGNDRYVPDVTLVRPGATYRNDMLDEGALLAVEIMSPGQTIGRLFTKCETYLAHGTVACWIIWPKRRQAWAYTSDGVVEVFAGQSLRSKAGEIALQISYDRLFADLPESSD